MRRNGNPAAHVHHDQPQLSYRLPLLARIAPRHRLGVQRMADARPLHQRRAGNPRARLPLVHRHRVHNVRVHVRPLLLQTATPAPRPGSRMFPAPRQPQFLHHRVVNKVSPAFHRRQQPAPSRHRRPGLRPFAFRSESCFGSAASITAARYSSRSSIGRPRNRSSSSSPW
jgi:hypothetical protein